MNIKDIYWLAGLLEGEGCFTTNHDSKYPNSKTKIIVKIAMSDEDVIRKLRKVTKLGTRNGPYGKMWYWNVATQSEAAAVMMTVYPLMCERRQKKIKELLYLWRNQ